MVDPIPAGAVILAEELEEWSDQINSVTAPGWTNYTPTWTNTTTNPALGNGSWTGTRYRRAAGGDLVHFEMCLTWGTTTTNGTGSWFTFGFPPVTPDGTELADFFCDAWLFDSSTSARNFNHGFVLSGGIIVANATGTNVSGTVPWTWATGDKFRLRGWYKAA